VFVQHSGGDREHGETGYVGYKHLIHLSIVGAVQCVLCELRKEIHCESNTYERLCCVRFTLLTCRRNTSYRIHHIILQNSRRANRPVAAERTEKTGLISAVYLSLFPESSNYLWHLTVSFR